MHMMIVRVTKNNESESHVINGMANLFSIQMSTNQPTMGLLMDKPFGGPFSLIFGIYKTRE